MQADPYWACAGAVNVMLVFFFRFNAEQLRRLNVYYWIICYGIPSIPAIFALIYRKNGEHMYGDATVKSPFDSSKPKQFGLHISTPDLTSLLPPSCTRCSNSRNPCHSTEKLRLTSDTQALVLVLKHLHHDAPLRLLHPNLDCRIPRNRSLHPRRNKNP